MKKIILILALIFSVNASSQYYKYFYFSVPAGEESEYLQMEGEHVLLPFEDIQILHLLEQRNKSIYSIVN